MSIIDRLNRFILVPILFEWLDLSDFIGFDSALCSHGHRDVLLQLVRSNSCVFQSKLIDLSCAIPLRVDSLKWLSSRNVAVSCFDKFRICVSWRWDKFAEWKEKIKFTVSRLIVERSGVKLDNYFRASLCLFSNIVELQCDDDSVTRKLLMHCVNLRSCRLTLRKQKEQLVTLLLRTNANLTSLQVNACVAADSSPNKFSKWFLPSLVVHGSNITSTSFNQCGSIKQRHLQIVALHHRRQFLDFSCGGFNDVSLRAFLWYRGSSLVSLDLSLCMALTDCVVEELVGSCLHLEDLNVAYCLRLTDVSVDRITQLSKLRVLSLQGLQNLTNSSLHYLGSLRGRLKSLSLGRQVKFTSEGVQVSSEALVSCSSLVFEELPDVLPHLPSIMMSLSSLTSLDLTHNRTLTDELLSAVLMALDCRKLLVLKLGGCELLRDTSLLVLAERCWYLEVLSVYSCCYFSANALLQLVTSCRQLRKLDLTYTHVSQSTLAALHDINCRLRIETLRVY